jgi:hypothetical protein
MLSYNRRHRYIGRMDSDADLNRDDLGLNFP